MPSNGNASWVQHALTQTHFRVHYDKTWFEKNRWQGHTTKEFGEPFQLEVNFGSKQNVGAMSHHR
jgi:hypothetical protein